MNTPPGFFFRTAAAPGGRPTGSRHRRHDESSAGCSGDTPQRNDEVLVGYGVGQYGQPGDERFQDPQRDVLAGAPVVGGRVAAALRHEFVAACSWSRKRRGRRPRTPPRAAGRGSARTGRAGRCPGRDLLTLPAQIGCREPAVERRDTQCGILEVKDAVGDVNLWVSWTPTVARVTATGSSTIAAWPSSGWNGSAASSPPPCAVSDATPTASHDVSPLTERPFTATEAATAARMSKALGDPIRLRLFASVAPCEGSEACVCDIFDVGSPSRPSPTA